MVLFRRKSKTIPLNVNYSPIKSINTQIPDNLMIRCPKCNKPLLTKNIGSDKTCYHCQYHLHLSAYDRINFIADKDSFEEINADIMKDKQFHFPGYQDKLNKIREKTKLNEAVVTGKILIHGLPCLIGVMDSRFIMGSMGSIVGEKITRLFEHGIENRLPVLIYSSSGGARMQEGIISLMQMAKISSVVKRHHNLGLLYISFITHPTTGGVTASFAMQGDYIFSEPMATLGFAGRRVIEQTINAKLPLEFQTAELALKNGFIDEIIGRKNQRQTLSNILLIHSEISNSEVK